MQGSTEIEESTSPCPNRSHGSQFIGNGGFFAQVQGECVIAFDISNHGGNECPPVVAQIPQAGELLNSFRFISGALRTFGHSVCVGLIKFHI